MLNYPYAHYVVSYKLCLCLLLLSNFKVLKQNKLLISQLRMLQTVTYVTSKLNGCLQILLVNGDQFLSFWFDFCFTALQHILGHFGRGQLT